MVKTFLTDSNNDLYIGNDGNLAIGTELIAILAACETASKAQRGEMVLAVNTGVPNFQLIWNGNANIAQYEASLRQTLLSVAGVLDVTNIDIQLSDNTLSYTATISTQFGTGVING